ncbi:MAG TPA: formylglycine-generating enzyme family protein [Phototrophicaceae bacterium]|nr:formylglycine-generating enzyme family protein [Phototrophicaceae bacterium]
MRGVLLLLLVVGVSHLIVTAQEVAPELPQAGETRVDKFGIEQVYVPAGCFLMGTSEAEADYARSLDAPEWAAKRLPSEQAQHEVCLSQGYWIDRYEVTHAAFQAFVDAGGYTTPDYWSDAGQKWLKRQKVERLPVECADTEAAHPRTCVTWFEAEAYARWRGGALPTEAQWEYAARGPEARIYPWGSEWNPDFANVVDSDGLTSVGSYPDGASWVGAEDMAGNAMEWVQDWLSSGYDSEAVTDPTGATRGTMKVEKGGWWGSNPVVARAAYRHFEDPPTYQDHHIGFRVVSPVTE